MKSGTIGSVRSITPAARRSIDATTTSTATGTTTASTGCGADRAKVASGAKRDRAQLAKKWVAVDMTLATLAVAYSIYLLYGAGYRYTTWAFMVVAAGIPVYAWQKWQAGKQHPELLHLELLDEIDELRIPETVSSK